MAAKIIDGVALAREMRETCHERVAKLENEYGIVPGLAVILVGDDPASAVYVRNKMRACAQVGIRSFRYDYPADVAGGPVLERIAALNASPEVHGILVQLPLPPQLPSDQILRA